MAKKKPITENMSYSQAKASASNRVNFAQNYMKCDESTTEGRKNRKTAIDDHGFTKDGWYVQEWTGSSGKYYAIVGPNNRYFKSIKDAQLVYDEVKLYNFQCTQIIEGGEVCGAVKEATANSKIGCKHCNKTNKVTPTEEEMDSDVLEARTWKLVTSEETAGKEVKVSLDVVILDNILFQTNTPTSHTY